MNSFLSNKFLYQYINVMLEKLKKLTFAILEKAR